MKGPVAVVLGSLLLLLNPGQATAQGEKEPAPRESRFTLTPTVAAPTGASGRVEFGGSASDVNTLSVRTQQLGPGLYWLSLVRNSDGATLRLGPIAVGNLNYQPDMHANNDFRQRNSTHQAHGVQTDSTVQLPPGWNAANIARVVVTDLNANPLPTGQPKGP